MLTAFSLPAQAEDLRAHFCSVGLFSFASFPSSSETLHISRLEPKLAPNTLIMEVPRPPASVRHGPPVCAQPGQNQETSATNELANLGYDFKVRLQKQGRLKSSFSG